MIGAVGRRLRAPVRPRRLGRDRRVALDDLGIGLENRRQLIDRGAVELVVVLAARRGLGGTLEQILDPQQLIDRGRQRFAGDGAGVVVGTKRQQLETYFVGARLGAVGIAMYFFVAGGVDLQLQA